MLNITFVSMLLKILSSKAAVSRLSVEIFLIHIEVGVSLFHMGKGYD